MHGLTVIALAIGASFADASPLVNRQAASSAVSAAVSSAVASIASSVAPATSSASTASMSMSMSSMSSSGASTTTGAPIISSSSRAANVSSTMTSMRNATNMTSTMTSSSATRTAPIVAPAATYAFTCPTGYNLGYFEDDATFPVPFMTALNSYNTMSNFSNATFPLNTTVATMALNNTRTSMVSGVNVTESLINVNVSLASQFAMYTLNLTQGPLAINRTMFSNYTTQVNYYGKAYTKDAQDYTTLVYFVNFCSNDTAAGQAVQNNLAAMRFAGIGRALGVQPILTTVVTARPTSMPVSATSSRPMNVTSMMNSTSMASSRPANVTSPISSMSMTSSMTSSSRPVSASVSSSVAAAITTGSTIIDSSVRSAVSAATGAVSSA